MWKVLIKSVVEWILLNYKKEPITYYDRFFNVTFY